MIASRPRPPILLACLAGAALSVGAGITREPRHVAEPTSIPMPAPTTITTTASGLSFEDLVPGAGASPTPGQTCVTHYTGWVWVNGAKGAKFDSSWDRREPFVVPIGKGQLIKGFEEGLASMRVGGKRRLIIPPTLAYGARGVGTVIPPNATLMFEIELLRLE